MPVFLLLILVPAVLCIELLWTLRLVRRGRLAQLAGGPPQDATIAATGSAIPAALPAQPAPAAVTEPAETGSDPRRRLVGWLLTVFGGLLASLGGLMILGVTLGLIVSGIDQEEVSAVVHGTIIIGFAPAALGAGLFRWGVVRLNRLG